MGQLTHYEKEEKKTKKDMDRRENISQAENKIGEKTRSDNNEKRLIKIVLALPALNLLLLTA